MLWKHVDEPPRVGEKSEEMVEHANLWEGNVSGSQKTIDHKISNKNLKLRSVWSDWGDKGGSMDNTRIDRVGNGDYELICRAKIVRKYYSLWST